MDIIGVDAGGTWVKATRFSSALEKVSDVRVPSGARDGVAAYFDSVATAVRQCSDDVSDIVVGVAVPGTFTKDRRAVRYAANIAGLGVESGGVVVAEQLMERLGPLRVVAENDAKCAALAEWARGWGKNDFNTFLLHVTWGTGIGTGFVARGEVAYGWEGGHMPVTWSHEEALGCVGDGCRCGCGSSTDVESHVAVPRLVDRAHALLRSGSFSTRLTEDDFVDRRQTSKVLVQYAEEGDPFAYALLRDAVSWLARGLHAMAIVAYPDVVAVGGAMMSSDWLLTELRGSVGELASGFTAATLQPGMVHRAQLGNEAGMVGAAVLAQGEL